MGVLCSTLDKYGEEPSEGKASPHISHIPSHGRLHKNKMPQFKRQVTRSSTNWRQALANRDFADEAAYTKALEELQIAERSRAFDAQVAHDATKIENEAADIVKKIRAYDWERTYGASVDNNGQSTGKRTEGEHFLG
jgi:adenosine deaminase CECR1